MYQPQQQNTAAYLQSLLPYLETEYCTRIERLCQAAGQHMTELHGGDAHQSALLYTSTGKHLIDQALQYLGMHRRALVPYIRQLLEKKDSGHDCRACSSACAIRHTAQIAGIEQAHAQIRETLGRLQAIDTSGSREPSLNRGAYQALCHEMAQLHAVLTELFYLEEMELIPKVKEAQKAIYAVYVPSIQTGCALPTR